MKHDELKARAMKDLVGNQPIVGIWTIERELVALTDRLKLVVSVAYDRGWRDALAADPDGEEDDDE